MSNFASLQELWKLWIFSELFFEGRFEFSFFFQSIQILTQKFPSHWKWFSNIPIFNKDSSYFFTRLSFWGQQIWPPTWTEDLLSRIFPWNIILKSSWGMSCLFAISSWILWTRAVLSISTGNACCELNLMKISNWLLSCDKDPPLAIQTTFWPWIKIYLTLLKSSWQC